MGIRFWRFRSQTPVTRDPERLTNMVEKLVRVGVLTPEEGRLLASDIFNREFRKLGDDWVKRPITLTLASVQGGQALETHTEKASLLDDARSLLRLRDDLEAEEGRMAEQRMSLVRKYLNQEAES
jgi:polyhydroxyalkanoate synthesis regulator phasin